MPRYAAVIFLLFLFLYIVPLGYRPLATPDETRYGEISRAMLTSGDWIVPRLNGVRYFEKPVLGYWLNALSMKVWGENAFAIRFPSAVATGLSGVLLWLLVRRFTVHTFPANLSVMVFLTMVEVLVVGVTCILDSLLTLFVTAAMVCFFYYDHAPKSAQQRVYAGAFGVCCGLACLTKGMVGLVIPLIAIFPFVLWQRRTKALLRHAGLAMATTLLTVAPWCILIQRREPDFLRYFIWTEHIQRFLSAGGGQHPEPFWFFVPVLLGGALPWILFLPPALMGWRKGKDATDLLKYVLCWLIFPFLFVSACSGKLTTYILPCFPALAILTGVGLHTYGMTTKPIHINGALRNLIILAGLAALALFGIQVLPCSWHLYGAGETWKWLLVLGGLLILGWVAWKAQRIQSVPAKMTLCGLALVPLLFSVHFAIPQRVIARKLPEAFLSSLPPIPRNAIVVADNYQATCAGWVWGDREVYLLGRTGEYAYGLNYADAKHRELDVPQFKQLLARMAGKRAVVLFTKADRYRDYESQIPKPASRITNGHFVFALFTGPRPDPDQVAGHSM